MTSETPEGDAAEQQAPLGAPPGEPVIGVETPEADALEQATAEVDAQDAEPTIDVEVPEADALEQAQAVQGDEEYRD
ncbi:MAG: hypothetical protein ABR520_12005 [Mycobacteriales bacterium]|nr:hypothetical protein [Frankia sp.]